LAEQRQWLETTLESIGDAVIAAHSTEAALSMLADGHVDLVVSDIGLPGVDGYDLMHRIRRLPTHAGGAIPAVALTAYARTEDRTRAFRAGYQAHLATPIEPAELMATMASFAGLIEAWRRSRHGAR
jgi:CheY-like chemotaxis protein